MILKNIALFLSTFLISHSLWAMEDQGWEIIDDGLHPVTVYIWKSVNGTEDGHISIQTNAHYMSFRPASDFLLQAPDSQCFAPLNLAMDQAIQNSKLGEGSVPWPCETITLYLDDKCMDTKWESLLESATVTPQGQYFTKVLYVTEKMRENPHEFYIADQENRKQQDEPTLFFINTTMAFGLLGKGKLLDMGVYFQDFSPYFSNELYCPPLSRTIGCFYDAFKENNIIRTSLLSVDYISSFLQDALKRQLFLKINKSLEQADYGCKSMTYENQNDLRKIVDAEEPIEEKQKKIQDYLIDLGKTHESQQSWTSLSGWANTLSFKGGR